MTDFTLVVDNDIGGGRGSLHFLILTTTLCFVDIFVRVRRVNLLLTFYRDAIFIFSKLGLDRNTFYFVHKVINGAVVNVMYRNG